MKNGGIWVRRAFFVYTFLSLSIVLARSSPDRALMKVQESILTAEQACALFPRTREQVKKLVDEAVKTAEDAMGLICDIKPSTRTFENTVRAYDKAFGLYVVALATLEVMGMVSPDKDLLDAAQEGHVVLNSGVVDIFESPHIYEAFHQCLGIKGFIEGLSKKEKYFFDDLMREFQRYGLGLPSDEFARVKDLKKEIASLNSVFDANIAKDASECVFSEDELAGVDASVCQNFSRSSEGKILVGCDYPTYAEVMKSCEVESTRKALYRAFNNRAYPVNEELLVKVLDTRHTLAMRLGFKSYADYDVDDTMAGSVDRVEKFLEGLMSHVAPKLSAHMALLKKDLPHGVVCDEQGNINPWDLEFVTAHYKKKNFLIDERAIAEYFPVDKALRGMLDVYQEFLGLRFEEVAPSSLWHEEVRLIKVFRVDGNEFLGHLFLDLYPRENKYTHACCCTVVPAVRYDDAACFEPGLVVVIANFPQSLPDKPALLKFDDVSTFFHEFGHAMHAFLGGGPFHLKSGTATKTDYVEMPSQIFEEWMFDPEVLRRVSCHFKTEKPLPEDIIQKKIDLKKFGAAYFVARQVGYALVSLKFHQGPVKDLKKLEAAIYQHCVPVITHDDKTHLYASFGHLTNYGALYYGYMWSRVFALDVFSVVKKQGLLSYAAGKKFSDVLLAPGGSEDPNEMLQLFLGREPNQEEFLRDIGV